MFKNIKINLNKLIETISMAFCFVFVCYIVLHLKTFTEHSLERGYDYPTGDLFIVIFGGAFSLSLFKLGVWSVHKYFKPWLKEDRKPGEDLRDVIQRLGNHIGGFFFYSATFFTLFY